MRLAALPGEFLGPTTVADAVADRSLPRPPPPLPPPSLPNADQKPLGVGEGGGEEGGVSSSDKVKVRKGAGVQGLMFCVQLVKDGAPHIRKRSSVPEHPSAVGALLWFTALVL